MRGTEPLRQSASPAAYTSAARAGEPERRIMRQTGHKSIEMVLRYVRNANQFTDNAALALGL
jgi:hypothetical protein